MVGKAVAHTTMSQRSVLSINAQVSTLQCCVRHIISSQSQIRRHFHLILHPV